MKKSLAKGLVYLSMDAIIVVVDGSFRNQHQAQKYCLQLLFVEFIADMSKDVPLNFIRLLYRCHHNYARRLNSGTR